MIQVCYFTNGGFVIHKAIDGTVSAWFDKDGKLLDTEKRDSLGRMVAVKKVEVLSSLEELGRIYKKDEEDVDVR